MYVYLKKYQQFKYGSTATTCNCLFLKDGGDEEEGSEADDDDDEDEDQDDDDDQEDEEDQEEEDEDGIYLSYVY